MIAGVEDDKNNSAVETSVGEGGDHDDEGDGDKKTQNN